MMLESYGFSQTTDTKQEVQANSVTYTRKDYLMLLERAAAAYGKLSRLRQEQIDAWIGDTAAREKDFHRLLRARWLRKYKSQYNAYISGLQSKPLVAFMRQLRGLPADKPDEYGSLEQYAEQWEPYTHYTAQFFKDRESWNETELPFYLRWLAENGRYFFDNEWKSPLDEVEKALRYVTGTDIEAKFIIPREEFDKYSDAMLKSVADKLEPVTGELRPSYGDTWW